MFVLQGAIGTDITIDTLCDIMVNASIGKEIDRYAAVNSLLLKTYGEKCLDVSYDTMIKDMREISWKSSASEGGKLFGILYLFIGLFQNHSFGLGFGSG